MGKDDENDLFEDLDSFFEPINEISWPEETGFEIPEAPEPVAASGETQVEVDQAVVDEDADDADDRDAADTAVLAEESAEGSDESDDDFAVASEDVDDVPDSPEAGDLAFAADAEAELVVGVGSDHNELIAPGGPAAGEPDLSPDVITDPSGEPTVLHFDEVGLVDGEPGMGLLTEDGIAIDDEGDEPISTFAPERDIEEEILADLAAPDPEESTATLADGLSGPSWHEPTHVDVGGDLESASAPRNMPAAFVTGVGLGAVAFLSLIWSPVLFAWLAGAAVLLAQFEFYVALQKRHLQPATIVGLIFGAFMLYSSYRYGVAGAAVFLAVGFIFSILWEIATPAKFRKQVTINVGLTVLGMAYIPFLAGFGMQILSRPLDPVGKVLMLLILGLTFAYDTAAFLLGSMWGEHQLAPQISPKKSVEGAVAGSLLVALIAVLLGPAAGLDLGDAVLLALVVVVAAPLGDLAESLLKRDLGIKDMGNILPGHGGVLDRIDSLLFVLPLSLLVVMTLPVA